MRLSVAMVVACSTLTGLAIADQLKDTIREPTNIEAQGLAPALQLFAKQRGIQVVYRSEFVADRKTNGATGELTTEEALAKLLSGTGLTFQYLSEKGVTIVPVGVSNSPAASSSLRTGEKLEGMQLAQAESLHQTATTPGMNQVEDSSTRSTDSFGNRIQEIVVTAQKREERLQDVPMSIGVITADAIERRGFLNSQDYLRGFPSVNQLDNGIGQTIVIRGIETSVGSQNFGAGVTTATYFGEAPTSNTGGTSGGSNVDIKLIDIERVEVLRGPQGTAFGNSSMGGAVRTIPVAPELDAFKGKVAADYSVTSGTGGGNYNIQAVGNLPLITDKLAVRAVAYQFEESGYYRNRAGSDPTYQSTTVIPLGLQGSAIDQEEVGAYQVVGGRVAALFQASEHLRFTLSHLTQKAETDGTPTTINGSYEQLALQVAPEHVFRGQKGGVFDKNIDLTNATVEYDLGWANMLATYSHTDSGSTYSIFNGLGIPISNAAPNDHRENVGEIRLTTQLDGALNFLAGAYAEELKDEAFYTYYWYGNPAAIPTYLNPGDRFVGDYLDRRVLKQKALFGEITWAFAPGFSLTGGVRAYDYERTVWTDRRGPLFLGPNNSSTVSGTNSSDASGTTFRANLSYKPAEDALFYAGWSQGFRLGKPQPGLAPGSCDTDADGIVDGAGYTIESTQSVDSDDIDSYELGGKFAFLDRRVTVDAAVFRMEWSGMPALVAAPFPPTGCGNTFTTNVGAAVSNGIEFQANLQISQPLRVSLGGSWIDARLSEDVPAQGLSSGNRLPGSPKLSGFLGLEYGFGIGDYPASVRADAIYVGPFFGNLLESPLTEAGDYMKLDTSLRVEISNLSVDLFVRNLTNEDAFSNRGGSAATPFAGFQLRPRTIGLHLSYDF